MTPQRLSEIKKKEQGKAAGFLEEREVRFLDYVEGELVADIRLKEIVGAIHEFPL